MADEPKLNPSNTSPAPSRFVATPVAPPSRFVATPVAQAPAGTTSRFVAEPPATSAPPAANTVSLSATAPNRRFVSEAGTEGSSLAGMKPMLQREAQRMKTDPTASGRLLDDVYRLTGETSVMNEAIRQGVGTPLAEAVVAGQGAWGWLNDVRQTTRDTFDKIPVAGKLIVWPMDAVAALSEGASTSLPSLLGAFDVPQNQLWKGAVEAGEYLPEDNETLQNLAGDATVLASKAMKWGMPGLASDAAMSMIDSAALKRLGVVVPTDEHADADAKDVLLAEVGKRFYKALADGSLARRAEQHLMDQEYFGHRFSNLNGEDLIDAAFSKEQAAELALRSEDATDRAFWTAMTTSTGRQAVGLAMEVALDPLWFIGAGEASRLVAVGDNMLRATGSVVADVGALGRHSNLDELALMTKLANDASAGTKTSLPLLREIEKNAMDTLAEAQKLAASAPSPSTAHLVTRAGRNIKTYEDDIRRVQRVINEVDSGDIAKRIVREGYGAWHAPFSAETRYAFDAEGTVAKGVKKLKGTAGNLLRPIADEMDRLDAVADAVRYGKVPDAALTAGNKVSLLVGGLAKAGRVSRSVLDVPSLVYDIMGRLLGTRMFHAAYIPEPNKWLKGMRVTEQAAKAGRPLGRPAAFGFARKVQASNAEEWNRFVDGLSKATLGQAARDQGLLRDVYRLYEEADQVWQERKALQGQPQGLGARIRAMWKGRDYTTDNVVLEAFDLVERGSGEYAKYLDMHPEMKNVVQHADLLFKAVAESGQVGIQQARQALQNMARNMVGDQARYEQYVAHLQQAIGVDALTNPAGADSALTAALTSAKMKLADLGKRLGLTDEAKKAADEAIKMADDQAALLKDMEAKGLHVNHDMHYDRALFRFKQLTHIAEQKVETYKTVLAQTPTQTEIDAVATEFATAEKRIATHAKMAQLRPKLPDFSGNLRDLHEWERDLNRAYTGVAQALMPNEPNAGLIGVILALRDEVKLPRDMVGPWTKDYLELLGQRFGDTPKEMENLTQMARDFVKKYEDMYTKVGFDFVKQPAERMKAWGVVNFAPHMLDEEAAVQRGQLMGATGGTFRPMTGLDARLSTKMDARRLREISGTVSEINATYTDGTRQFGVTPQLLLARFMQSNKAVTAQEFMVSLLQSGAVKAFNEGEAAVDYIPLLNAGEKSRAYDILLAGSRGEWDVLTPGEIRQGLAQLRKGDPLKGADPFAAWVNEIPEIRQGNVLERMVVEVNAERALLNKPPFVVPPQGSAADVFDAAAAELNRDYFDLVARLGQNDEGVIALKTSGPWMATYQQTDIRKMYVAADVYQNTVDALDIVSQISETPVFSAMKKASDTIGNYVKARLTIYRTAFHVRNLLWNTFSNMLDLGPFGALNPRTNIDANRLAMLGHYYQTYGSIAEAEKVLSAGRRSTESAMAYYWRKTKLTNLRSAAREWKTVGVNLGDGITRPLDEALDYMVKKGVIGGAYTDFNDLANFEQGVQELYAKGGMAEVKKGVRFALQKAEQYGLQGLALMVGGKWAITTVLPKDVGKLFANYIENMTRTVNFLGNAKRTGSLDEATAHVMKTLFHYDDLSAFQKVWMRSIFLFYSWNMKNLYFHAQMAVDRPVVYSQAYRLMVDGGPELLQTYLDETAGQEHRETTRFSKIDERALYDQEKHKFSIPLNPQGNTRLAITGFGSPIEGAIDQGMSIAELAGGDPRVFASTQATIRMTIEALTQHSLYYDKPFSELNSGRSIGQILAGLHANADYLDQAGLDHAAATMRYLAQVVETGTEFEARATTNRSQRARTEATTVSNRAAFVLAQLPWKALLNDFGAITDAYSIALPEDSGDGGGHYETVPWQWRALDALAGISLTQMDVMRRQQQADRKRDKAILDILEPRGHVQNMEMPVIQD